jgi:penicillin-binding protein 1C
MDWIYPREFSRIKVPKNLDGSLSKTVFQLAHRIPEKVVYWHLDGQFIGKTRLYHQISLQPTAGRHRVMAMDEDGNRVFAAFEILQNTPSR